jgi:hypothetical protein
MDRNLWKSNLTFEHSRPWPCPRCKTGRLQLVKESIQTFETRASIEARQAQAEGEWEPDVPFFRFTCVLRCHQSACKEPVVVSGHTTYEQEQEPEGGWTWAHYLQPLFFHPPPPIIPIPDSCPKLVRQAIEGAFALYWCDRSSCANKLRLATEELLTALRVPLTQTDPAKHRRNRLKLHRRIELLDAKDHRLATQLFAVKWIGNEGSHPGSLTADDLLDAFVILGDALQRLFPPPDADHALNIAKLIHKTKKPRSRQRK